MPGPFGKGLALAAGAFGRHADIPIDGEGPGHAARLRCNKA